MDKPDFNMDGLKSLTLTLKPGEYNYLTDEAGNIFGMYKVVEIRGGAVRIATVAPPAIKVFRCALYDKMIASGKLRPTRAFKDAKPPTAPQQPENSDDYVNAKPDVAPAASPSIKGATTLVASVAQPDSPAQAAGRSHMRRDAQPAVAPPLGGNAPPVTIAPVTLSGAKAEGAEMPPVTMH